MKPRNKTLRIRLRQDEYSHIENVAWGKRQKVSDYVREVLVPRTRPLVAKVAKEPNAVRSETLIVKLSKAEKVALKDAAGEVSLSRYVRSLLTEPANPYSKSPASYVRTNAEDEKITTFRDDSYQE